MADACSISLQQRFGIQRICKHSNQSRSRHYYKPERVCAEFKVKTGPKVKVSDESILEHARRLLSECPFLGDGYRKLHARLRFEGILVGKDRLLRLLRENNLLAQSPSLNRRGPRHHTGVIGTAKPDEIWGTDFTFTRTEEDGMVPVFIAIDHFNTECLGIHASLRANRFEALEPLRQAIACRFGKVEKEIVQGLKLRHDHGTQYVSHHFQQEKNGMESNQVHPLSGSQKGMVWQKELSKH